MPIVMFPMLEWSFAQPLHAMMVQEQQEAEDILTCSRESGPPFSITQTRLLELLDQSGEDDYGERGPTQYAFKNALMLISQAEAALVDKVPGSSVVDSNGGIRTTWHYGGRQVRLICPAAPDRNVYIYQQAGDAKPSIINENVTASTLRNRLLWLVALVRPGKPSVDSL